MANAAYWYDSKSGKFITSTYCMKELPSWVNHFNAVRIQAMLMNSEWKLEDGKNYETSLPDNGPGEEEVFVEDIAPTITDLIHIQEPDATIDIPLLK